MADVHCQLYYSRSGCTIGAGPGAKLAWAKLVCIAVQPYTTTQAQDRSDILNVGGFSDAVFSVVAAFLTEDTGRFVAEVEAIEM